MLGRWQHPAGKGTRVRDECLNINIFWSVTHARVVISDWKEDYNTRRRSPSRLATRPQQPMLPSAPTVERLSHDVDQFPGSGPGRLAAVPARLVRTRPADSLYSFYPSDSVHHSSCA